MADKLVFEQTIDGLYARGLGRRVTPELKARLRALGMDLDGKLLPAYPFETWMKALEATAELLYPELPTDQAMFHVGESFIEGYRDTLLGRAVLGTVRVLGPHRALARARQSFRSGNNYTEATLTPLGAEATELWMNEVGPWPGFTAGIIHAALTAAGVVPVVVPTQHDGHACTYRITWTKA